MPLVPADKAQQSVDELLRLFLVAEVPAVVQLDQLRTGNPVMHFFGPAGWADEIESTTDD